jgi:hypothetical protein
MYPLNFKGTMESGLPSQLATLQVLIEQTVGRISDSLAVSFLLLVGARITFKVYYFRLGA